MSNGAIEAAFYAELGRKLWQKRIQREWSRAALAAELGCHRNTIERWELGETAIDLMMLLRVCDILSCQHLLLLPAREFTWGKDYQVLKRERDQVLKTVQVERDPKLTDAEINRLRA